MSIKQEVSKHITKINRIANSLKNNTNLEDMKARVEAEKIVLEDIIMSKLKVEGVKNDR